MTFLEFKTELISRYRQNEFDQFLHLLIKAANWNELLTLLKKEPLKYIIYGISKGIISESFLLEIPEIERENNNIYNSSVSLTDVTDTVFLFGNGDLSITQNNSFRSKIVLIGTASVTAISNDTSMLEINLNENSTADVTCNDDSFIHLTANQNSSVDLIAKDNTTVKLLGYGNSIINSNLINTSFLNGLLEWSSKIIFTDTLPDNYKIKLKDKASIEIATETIE